MAATAINAAINAYSIAVTPQLSSTRVKRQAILSLLDSGRAMPDVPHYYLSGDLSTPRFNVKKLRVS
jgi:hypothetical protein